MNIWPRRAGDGVQSAYLVEGAGKIISIAVNPLARSLDVQALESKPLGKPQVERGTVGIPTLAVIPFPNATTVAITPLEEKGPVFHVENTDARWADLITAVNRLARTFGHSEIPVFGITGVAARKLSLRDAADTRLGQEGYRITCDSANSRYWRIQATVFGTAC